MTISLAFANGHDIKVHAATCADLKKAPTKRAAYNGIHTQDFADGTDERDVWEDFNIDFLEEGGADAAYPLVFLPCCAAAGLVANDDRTWGEAEPAPSAHAHEDLRGILDNRDDKAARNAAIVAALDAGSLDAKQIADALGIEARAVNEAAARFRARQG
jgi:hypothetical protein